MRSILESDPALVTSLGLITARWSVLEDQLGQLLGQFTKAPRVGHAMIYGVSNFSQRRALVEMTLQMGLATQRHKDLSLKLMGCIARLWKSRNSLVHSLYVCRIEGTFGHTDYSHFQPGEEPDIAELPRLTFGAIRINDEVIADGESDIETARGIGYRHHGTPTSSPDFRPVNNGTMTNHADAVMRRSRQMSVLTRAIQRGRVPLAGVER